MNFGFWGHFTSYKLKITQKYTIMEARNEKVICSNEHLKPTKVSFFAIKPTKARFLSLKTNTKLYR